jgi:hypothetical protein
MARHAASVVLRDEVLSATRATVTGGVVAIAARRSGSGVATSLVSERQDSGSKRRYLTNRGECTSASVLAAAAKVRWTCE